MPRVDRREQISAAVFAGIAEHGLEGLRTRDVAARAGVNIATVHYYFATKEDLITAAYQLLQQRFGASLPESGSPAERLAGHLTGVLELLIGDAELRRVLAELALRADRDPRLAADIAAAENAWLANLRDLVTAGTEQGCWAVEVDPDAFAVTCVALLKGTCMPTLLTTRAGELRRAVDQLLSWLTGRATLTT
ncbi:TetR/AcrR family transcriptional regulator [Microlunatus parietis]|uniref:AcrR family transcriptional regulator n=1 Tax=Microlunatus parietis TaxID=682979 RepID=A0A7Y9IAZ7_9ACTN|nr:TetR/AcrR family transcriptional regulator [Microlunatus parietis]NYE73520.1 AcrR family transcriptional regulator [Microlunatus parietis]